MSIEPLYLIMSKQLFKKMKNILFLCTGNSCRSQMAEGWGKHLLGDQFSFLSAGTKKHGLNPNAVKVMKEVGVDISNHKSNTLSEITSTLDFIITVCSDADQNCPFVPGAKVIHRGFEDPPRLAEKLKSEEDILVVYRRVRDEIKEMVLSLPELIEKEIK